MASATTPRIRILMIPRPAAIQSQPQVESKTARESFPKVGNCFIEK
jgi:hypothetical protein